MAANRNEIIVQKDDSKSAIRKKVWDHMDHNKIAAFPFPPHHRIPNYKTSEMTASKLLEVECFKNAKTLKVDPDKPLQHIRYNALQGNKVLYVPTPRLTKNFLNKIDPSLDSKQNWFLSSKQGLMKNGQAIDISENHFVDLCIVGAVAVSYQGCRIGKGEGFSDLEHAIMTQANIIHPTNTKVVACVHDCQVFDHLPPRIFQKHDVPVHFIVTPSRIITCHDDGADVAHHINDITVDDNENIKGDFGDIDAARCVDNHCGAVNYITPANSAKRNENKLGQWRIHWDLLTPQKISSIPILQRLRPAE